MKKLFTILALAISAATHAQSVGINTAPAASAALDVSSTTKGMLVPRMTQAQRNAIATPATGLLIYQTDNTPGFYSYSGTAWSAVGGAQAGAGLQLFVTSTNVQNKSPYAYSRYTFNYDNKLGGSNQAAWTNNNTYTVPTGFDGLYNINLAIIMTAINTSGSFISFVPFPEIQLTRGSVISYYYGVGNYSSLLGGDNTDATANGSSASTPQSFGRGNLTVTLPLVAGDILKVFYRGNTTANGNGSVNFSTDGSSYLSITKLN